MEAVRSVLTVNIGGNAASGLMATAEDGVIGIEAPITAFYTFRSLPCQTEYN
jgi:hypothetical protein